MWGHPGTAPGILRCPVHTESCPTAARVCPGDSAWVHFHLRIALGRAVPAHSTAAGAPFSPGIFPHGQGSSPRLSYCSAVPSRSREDSAGTQYGVPHPSLSLGARPSPALHAPGCRLSSHSPVGSQQHRAARPSTSVIPLPSMGVFSPPTRGLLAGAASPTACCCP